MGRVRHDHLAARISFPGMIRADDEHSGQFPVRARRRLERKRVHAGYFTKQLFELEEQLQPTLRGGWRLIGMEVRKSRQRGQLVVNLWVVLHGAGTERVEMRVHAEIQLGQPRKMS